MFPNLRDAELATSNSVLRLKAMLFDGDPGPVGGARRAHLCVHCISQMDSAFKYVQQNPEGYVCRPKANGFYALGLQIPWSVCTVDWTPAW